MTNISSIEYDDGRYYSPKGHTRIYDRKRIRNGPDSELTIMQDRENLTDISMGHSNTTRILHRNCLIEAYQNSRNGMTRKISYEAELYDLQADIGDTIQIADNRYREKIYLSARVQEVQNHYTVVGEDTGNLLIIH